MQILLDQMKSESCPLQPQPHLALLSCPFMVSSVLVITLGILDCPANDSLGRRAKFCFGENTYTSVEHACWVKMHRWVQRTGRRTEAACGGRFIGPVKWPVGLAHCVLPGGLPWLGMGREFQRPRMLGSRDLCRMGVSWAGQGSGTGVGACPRQGFASYLSFHFLPPPLEMGTVWGTGQGFLPRRERRMYQIKIDGLFRARESYQSGILSLSSP